MVMIARFLLVYILLICKPLFALESVHAELDRDSIELGKAVTMIISANDSKIDLSALPLDELRDYFATGSRDYSKEIFAPGSRDTNNRQQLRLQLYPRQTGNLTVPSIRIGSRFTGEIPLHVIAAKRKGGSIDVDWHLNRTEAWQRQQVIVRVQITTPEEFATLELQEREVHGYQLTPLPVTRVKKADDSNSRTVLSTGWSVLPLLHGEQTLTLPAIEYHSDGVRRRLFYPPTMQLTVRPLPSYLPPTIPVGRIGVTSRVSPEKIHYPGETAYWNITLTSQSLPPYWLPPVLRQIKSNEDVDFLPASSKRETRPNESGVNGSVQHSVPFKVLHNGITELPELDIQYFDTETGKISTITHRPEQLLAASLPLRLLLATLLLAALAWSGYLIIKRVVGYYHYRRKYREIVRRLQDASSIDQLSAILDDISKTESWPDNIPLSLWLRRWQEKFGSSDDLSAAINQLSRMKYSSPKKNADKNRVLDITAIRRSIEEAINNRKKLLTTLR